MLRGAATRIDPLSEDVVFQIVNWQAFDHEYSSPMSEPPEQEGGRYLIKLYGVSAKGESVSANIMNYTPFFFIKVNHNINSLFLDRLREHIIMRLPNAVKDSFLGVKLMKKKDFWGFTNNTRFNYIRLTFTSLNAFRAGTRLFQRDIQIMGIHKQPVRYKIYESNIEPFVRFMHIKDIMPAGWVRLAAKSYDCNTDILPTTCQIDVSCEWKAVERVDRDKIAPVLVASFDIECTSSHGDFPVAQKDYKKVAYELLQAFLDDKINACNIAAEVMCMFDHGAPGILSKVFPKEGFNQEYVLSRLQRGAEDMINILRGKLVFRKDKYNPVPKASKEEIMRTLTRKLGTYEDGLWTGFMPKLEGDPIIQIGTTVHRYGETECFYKNIITVGTCEPIDGVDVVACETEAEAIQKWQELVLAIDPDVVIGYNIFGFDFAYMYDRAKEVGMKERFCKLGKVVDKSCQFVEKTLSSSALGDNLLRYVDMDGRVIIDIMKVVQRDHRLDSYKLDNVAHHFMKMNKNDVSPNDIFRLQKGSAEDRKTIAEYCVQDCALCNKLVMKLEILANNIGMANVCNVPLSYIFMRGQGVKIFSLVSKQCREDDYMIPAIYKPRPPPGQEEEPNPEEEEGYEGAIVLPPKEGIYLQDPVSVLDYASLYPSSMISENLSHDCIVIDPKYDNLEGVEYLDISYDVYDMVDDKKVKVGEKVCRFVQLPNGEKGVIPRILMKLLKARKDTRKKIEYQTVTTTSGEEITGLLDDSSDPDTYTLKRVDGTKDVVSRSEVASTRPTYDEFEKAVLDGLQLAYKVTANSLYGQVGARTSPIYLKEIAACTTATGRKMIMMARDYMIANYEGVEIVYGDSVTGYTPVKVRWEGRVYIMDIETVALQFGCGWLPCTEEGKQTKEACNVLDGLEAWTDEGWTEIKRVIRHALAPHKKVIRVWTDDSCVDVTDDHSLFKSNGEKVSPKDLTVGTSLLHEHCSHHGKPFDGIAYDAGVAAIATHDIVNSCIQSKQNFFRGFASRPGETHFKTQVEAAMLCQVLASLRVAYTVFKSNDGYSVKVHALSSNDTTVCTRMEEVQYKGFVYDFTTGNHRFQAGIGNLVVSNTDSLFIKFPINPANEPIDHQEKIKRAWDMGSEASHNFRKLIKHPHDLEMEKVMFPFILFSKKRYCAHKYEGPGGKPKLNSMGIVLKRRDNAPIVKHVYGGIIDIIMNEQDIRKSVAFLKTNLEDLIGGKIPLEDLVITKSLRADYKDPERIAHKVLAERMGERDPGNKPMVNDRIPFVYIQDPNPKRPKTEKLLQGDRIEHPDYIRKQGLKPDYEFYITNQIMKPVLQLYALTLETLDGYKKGQGHFHDVEKKLVVEKGGDMKKVKDRLGDLREAEVKKLMFDPILTKLQNKKAGNREITEFFTAR